MKVRKMRKIIGLILILALLTGLTACQQTPATTESPQSSATQAETTPVATVPEETKATETPAATAAPTQESTEAPEFVDYVEKLKLNMQSETVKQIVTVKSFVDGDTTHFNVPDNVAEGGVLKARYLAINTPESTGKIEEYGKTASKFTREKLENAAEILIESDDSKWNVDSTGGRYLVWVWYKAEKNSEWRNLNLEILQNGLAIANSSANNRYGSYCTQAIAQARTFKLAIYSGQKDPNFYYGEAMELSLREIRLHPKDYEGNKVAFEGVVARGGNGTVYVEEYDAELDLYFGISIYLGYDLSGDGLAIMSIGNRVRVVGTLQYYEAGGTWQVSGLSYRAMRPNDPNNIQKLGDGFQAAYPLTDPKTFAEGKVTVEGEETAFDYAYLTMDSTLCMNGLKVRSYTTTDKEDSSSYGAITLYCEADGTEITLRTGVFHHEDGSLVTGDEYQGKTVNVKGIVSYFDGHYQIKILTPEDIEILP